jgi:phage replication O-like protein O
MDATYKGVEQPNHTQTPNSFYDELLPQITSLCELKVTLAIIRKTFGWRKHEDQLSVSQLETLTGLSRKGVQDGLTLALKRGSIVRREQGQKFFYSLKLCNDIARPEQPAMQQSCIEPCNDLYPQKKVNKNTNSPTESVQPISPPSRLTTTDSSLWKLGIEVLCVEGESRKSIGGLLYREIKKHGEKRIEAALNETKLKQPVQPKSYFLGILKHKSETEDFYADFIKRMEERPRYEYPRERPPRQIGRIQIFDSEEFPLPMQRTA